ncbi:hypothetical protein ABH944_005539 [Caballeronia udeis]|uniref:Lipoprotein n=1 Tax=Caballeronia udeis TaxID=1232866 RepID=A0ABW8MP69_9BURK
MRTRTYFVGYAIVWSLSIFAGCSTGGVINNTADSRATPETMRPLATKGDANSQRALVKGDIDQDFSSWKSTEAHAISQSEARWPALVEAHPDMATTEDVAVGFGKQIFVRQFTAPNNEIVGKLTCKKYFSDLASGIWRKGTPKMYGFLDQMH